MTSSPDKNRTRYYKLLPIAKRDLMMDEAEYRDLLKRHGAKLKDGKYSATTMTPRGLAAALAECRNRGFVVRRKAVTDRKADWRRARIAKITAIWCALHDAGVVRERSEAAMQKWCYSITKKNRLEWADSDELNRCIEALKKWAWREKVKLRE